MVLMILSLGSKRSFTPSSLPWQTFSAWSSWPVWGLLLPRALKKVVERRTCTFFLQVCHSQQRKGKMLAEDAAHFLEFFTPSSQLSRIKHYRKCTLLLLNSKHTVYFYSIEYTVLTCVIDSPLMCVFLSVPFPGWANTVSSLRNWSNWISSFRKWSVYQEVLFFAYVFF